MPEEGITRMEEEDHTRTPKPAGHLMHPDDSANGYGVIGGDGEAIVTYHDMGGMEYRWRWYAGPSTYWERLKPGVSFGQPPTGDVETDPPTLQVLNAVLDALVSWDEVMDR